MLVIYHWQEFPLPVFWYQRYLPSTNPAKQRKARWHRKALHKLTPVLCLAPLHVPHGNLCLSSRYLQVIMHYVNLLSYFVQARLKQKNHKHLLAVLTNPPAAALLCFAQVQSCGKAAELAPVPLLALPQPPQPYSWIALGQPVYAPLNAPQC